MATIHQIIGKVNPALYAENKEDLLEKYKSQDKIPANEVKPKPLLQHTLVYDSSSETLEPVYFFILDLMNDMRLSPEKIVDNFSPSPGSGHFSELGQRATIMQQQATKILGDINNVTRSILNLVYDLKEFKIRLQSYEDMKSQKKETKEAALLSLKQIWMDKVDINKGNSSIKALAVAGGVGYQTLIDAFLFVQDEKQADKVDLNDRVKRIVKQRIQEFNLWLSESEKELKKRYEIERKYLKSQVNSVKIYARWAKPYLRAAQQLEISDSSGNPALVKAFNTILLELTLLGTSKVDIKGAVGEEKLPKDFLRLMKKGDLKRDYVSCVVVDFNFRGIPQRVAQQPHYTFGGRAEIKFTAYALNSDELKKVHEELSKSDIADAFGLIEGATSNLEELQDDIDAFLKEEEKSEKSAEKKLKEDMSNPFLALLGFYNKTEGSIFRPRVELDKSLKPDNYAEKNYLRVLATAGAKETTFKLFEVYKKAHGMPTYP
ncbi:MAG: hypothetical protein KGH55_02560 [Nanoarchaeota archaeon]|nr:hypothetical protein [Nanoarchaeota archaeon]